MVRLKVWPPSPATAKAAALIPPAFGAPTVPVRVRLPEASTATVAVPVPGFTIVPKFRFVLEVRYIG